MGLGPIDDESTMFTLAPKSLRSPDRPVLREDTMAVIERNGVVEPEEIADVRQSVGWDRSEETYTRTLSVLYSYYTVRLNERLIGYLGVVSDGVADGMLLDIVIHRD